MKRFLYTCCKCIDRRFHLFVPQEGNHLLSLLQTCGTVFQHEDCLQLGTNFFASGSWHIAKYIPHKMNDTPLVFRVRKDIFYGLYQAESFISDHDPGSRQASFLQ